MRGAIGSLNAAVAGSILLFEAVAQRDPEGLATAAPVAGPAEADAAAEARPERGADVEDDDAGAMPVDAPATPKRRATRKATAAPTDAPTAEATAAPVDGSTTGHVTAAKPKRRAPRKATPAPTDAPPAEPTDRSDDADAPAAKPKRRAPRTAAKPVEPSASTGDDLLPGGPVPADVPEPPVDTPKPARRRRGPRLTHPAR